MICVLFRTQQRRHNFSVNQVNEELIFFLKLFKNTKYDASVKYQPYWEWCSPSQLPNKEVRTWAIRSKSIATSHAGVLE